MLLGLNSPVYKFPQLHADGSMLLEEPPHELNIKPAVATTKNNLLPFVFS